MASSMAEGHICPLLSVAGPSTHSVHLAAVDAHSAEGYGFIRWGHASWCVCVCVCERERESGMHRSAVLEEKQDTGPRLILSHVLCMPVMSGRELGCVCVCVCELRVATEAHICINTLALAPLLPFGAVLCRSHETFKVSSGFVQEIRAAGL